MKISQWIKCRSLTNLDLQQAIPIADYAKTEYLSKAQVYRMIAKREIVAKKIKSRWYVFPDS